MARPSPARILLLILASLGFVALGAWIAGLFGPAPEPGREWQGWLAIIFFGLCAVFGVTRLFEKGEVIVVDAEGIYWRRWSPRPIPWSAIRAAELRTIRRNRLLCLHLEDGASAAPGGVKGWMGAANRGLGFGDVTISTAGTDRSFKQLMEAVRRFAPAETIVE